MKRRALLIVMLAWSGVSLAVAGGETIIVSLKGPVWIRHDVREVWTRAAVGDVLKPFDSVKLEANAAATVRTGTTTIVLPASVVLDVSDLRTIPQEDFLLRLAMEKVRALPHSLPRPNDRIFPVTTTIHGSDRRPPIGEQHALDPLLPMLQLNGTRVLFQHGYFQTCVLRAKELFRRNPELSLRMDDRLMVAEALDRLALAAEALEEYRTLADSENLSADQLRFVRSAIERLQPSMGR